MERFNILKDNINREKNKLTKPYNFNKRLFHGIAKSNDFLIFAPNIKGINNAYAKAREMYLRLDVFNKNDHILHFDNASFPGSFIMAALDLQPKNYTWKASSIVINNKSYLGDGYKLYRNYPDNYLMTTYDDGGTPGDVTNIKYLFHLMNSLNHSVDLYTSDLGFGIGDKYEEQEILHIPAHLGQIIAAIMTLKTGGTMIVKQYTLLEEFSISMFCVVYEMFESLELFKPHFSKRANSEAYIIGTGFKGYEHCIPYLVQMLNKLHMEDFTPFIPIDQLNKNLLEYLYMIQKKIIENQTIAINQIVKDFEEKKRFKEIKLRTFRRYQSSGANLVFR
jgi:hypothetical protein